jgi:hypothetical protein
MLRRVSSLGLLAALGCGTTVVYEEGPPGGPPGEEPECIEPIDPADVVEVEGVTSATLFGEHLHVEGIVGGEPGYAVLDVSREPARLVALRPDLLGGARWIRAAAGEHYARIRGRRLDVIDASEPADVRLVSSTDLGVEQPAGWAQALASDGDGVLLCMRSGEVDVLSRIDLTDPASPGAPLPRFSFGCERYGDRSYAEGALWVSWGATNVALFDLDVSGEQSIVSHAYEPQGVHQYGELTAVKGDEEIVATTMENDRYAFLYYRHSPETPYTYSSFGRGEKQLVAVMHGQAVLVVPQGDELAVTSFDISTPPAWLEPVPATAMDVVLTGSDAELGSFAAVARDASRLVLAEPDALYFVPLGGTAPVEPLVVVRDGAGPPLCP